LNVRLQGDEGVLMLRSLIAILLVFWLLGFALHVAGGFIHILVVIAAIVLVIDLVKPKRA